MLSGLPAATAQPRFNPGTGLSTNWDWAKLVLEDGGWPVTANNLKVLTQWMGSEEPPSDWWDRDNPLNSGYGAGGGSGLGRYPDLATAAYEVVVSLSLGANGYAAITADLAASDPPATTAKAIWASAWASGHYGHGAYWYTGTPPIVPAPLTAWTAEGELLRVSGQATTWEAVGGGLLYVRPAALGPLEQQSGQTAPLAVTAEELALFRRVPADGTVLRALPSGRYFVVAGGAALYSPSCATLPACAGAVPVDQWNVAPANFPSPADHLAETPADGTALLDASTGVGYVVAGGAPLAVAHWADVGSPAAVTVADWIVANAGVRGVKPFDGLTRLPRAGTLLRAGPTGRIYLVDGGGHAVYQPAPPPGAPVVVDAAAVDEAGGGGPWGHLVNAAPVVPFTPAQVTTAAGTVVVHYPMPVLSSALRAVSVRYRLRSADGHLWVWHLPDAWRMTGAPDVTFSGLAAGQTVCFEVRATDVDGVSSPWTGDRCWTRR